VTLRDRLRRGVPTPVRERVAADPPRLLALLAVALTLGAPLRTMFHLIDVVGSPTLFLVLTALALLGATALSRVVRPRIAILVGAVIFGVGLIWYVLNLPTDPSLAALIRDTFALLSGRSLLQIADVRLWVLSFAPAPVFLTWYFGLRRWYGTAVLAAGTALAFLVLTTDAGLVTTLLGVVGGAATLGLGDVDRRADTLGSAETVAAVLAVMLLVPSVATAAPLGGGSVLSFAEQGERPTVEGSLVESDATVAIQGSIRLSPEVRYTVQSTEPRYWKAGSYDRYTGDGWVRSGTSQAYSGRLSAPPGPTRTVRQEFTAESAIRTVPAAWKPVQYRGGPNVTVTTPGTLQPVRSLSTGERYRVRSEVPTATPRQLRNASTDYPDRITEKYTQLPDSTPDRVRERTSVLTANADNPYETALVVEQWLENNREYSLDVDRPERNVADSFLFEMEAGYCTYFATTMVTMLRSQGVPARLAVGYTPGQQVADDRWVVRGLDSHAWVEVYFPEHGWIQFDPTPSGPRSQAEQTAVEAARANNETGVDTSETEDEGITPTPTPTPPPLTETNATDTPTATPTTDNGSTATLTRPGGAGAAGTTDGGGGLPELPSREEATLGVVALVGLVAGARRLGVTTRARRALWLRYQRREDPATDTETAFQRAMYVLGQRERPRQPGETVRAYLDGVDAPEDIRRLAALRERARYAGTVDESTADEAVEIADSIVRDR